MNQEQLLAHHGWTLECEGPLEIRHAESNSFASGYAAQLVIDSLTQPEDALQVYESSSRPAPPVATWPLSRELYQDYIDGDKILTFTALMPLEKLVHGDIDELNDYCQQAFGDDVEIGNTEFRVIPVESEATDWDGRLQGDVPLQVSCTLSAADY